MNVLTLNAGSNSLKFEIVATLPAGTADPTRPAPFGCSLISGSYDDIGRENSAFSLFERKQVRHREEIEVRDHGHAAELVFDWIKRGGARDRGIHGLSDIERIAHRIVHGGDRFNAPARITDGVVNEIEKLEELAPLHNQPALKVIRAAQSAIGTRVPMFGVFDTTFHQAIPDEAALYALPFDVAQRHKIRRYGFHGISHRYLMLRYSQITERPVSETNLITLHLEGGSSAAAIRRGKSIDTSMGFTPLEGLMMGTRTGDIDPAIVTYLMRKENLDGGQVEKLLNKESGLLGVSGISADTRELCRRTSELRVDLALRMFSYRVRKYIGAYLSVLGGAEAIVFGGGIGENTPLVRELICENLDWCGAALDRERSRETVDQEGQISTPESAIDIWVIPTQEGLMMAADVSDCK
jgi:acetate kinase